MHLMSLNYGFWEFLVSLEIFLWSICYDIICNSPNFEKRTFWKMVNLQLCFDKLKSRANLWKKVTLKNSLVAKFNLFKNVTFLSALGKLFF
jgi:hypothetical protein